MICLPNHRFYKKRIEGLFPLICFSFVFVERRKYKSSIIVAFATKYSMLHCNIFDEMGNF